jgi:hypothetical protein
VLSAWGSFCSPFTPDVTDILKFSYTCGIV